MDLSTIHILTFPTQDIPRATCIDDLAIVLGQDILGIWTGECIEDPELTFVVVAGKFPEGLDLSSFFRLTPKQQQRTELPVPALVQCLNAPVTEVASSVLKANCNHTQALSLIDAAMQTVLDADDCTAAVWKTSAAKAIFFVGWRFLEAHEKYHQVIFANPPDCIKQLPSIVESSVVSHVVFRPVNNPMNSKTP